MVALWCVTALCCFSCALAGQTTLVPETVTEDPSLQRVEIKVAGVERSVHIVSYGDEGAPVMMVAPGSLSDTRTYAAFEAFSDAYRVVIWDMRGCGLSERVGADELSIESMAEEMHAMKTLLSPDSPVTIVGHSWSASFAAIFCGRYPDDVIQAVLIEAPGLKAEFMEGLDQKLNLTSVGYCDMNWFNASLSPSDHERLDFAMLAMLEAGVRDFFVDIDDKPPWPVYRIGGLALLTWEKEIIGADGTWDFDHSEGLADFSPTVLIVGSSHSPIGYDFQRKTNATVFRSADLLLIDQSGHRIITEQWDALETGLRSYLAQY